MKIAFILGKFPCISETFILNQITGLIDAGHKIDIYAEYAVRNHKSEKQHNDFERYNLHQITHYHPLIPNNCILRILYACILFFRYFAFAPLLTLRSINVFKYKRVALNLNLFYRTIPFIGRAASYDIIHSHHGTVGKMASVLKEIKAISGKLVVSFHGYDINVFPHIHGSAIYRDLFQKADICIANSEFTVSKLQEIGCPENKIIQLPVGIDLNKYPYSAKESSFNDRAVKIITVARLVEKKGLIYSITAVSRIISMGFNIEYNILGDGPLFIPLSKLISKLSCQEQIHILGWKNQEEVNRFYQDSDIFLLTSVTASNQDREGQGVVLLEAQSVGLPVIATLHNGFPTSVQNGRSAFLVPEKDIEALVERLVYIINRPEICHMMGKAGRKYVENKFDIRIINYNLIKIYQSLLNPQ